MATKFVRYSDFVAGAQVTIEHNETINQYQVEIGNLRMLVQDWEQLQQRVNELLVEAGYTKGSSVV